MCHVNKALSALAPFLLSLVDPDAENKV